MTRAAHGGVHRRAGAWRAGGRGKVGGFAHRRDPRHVARIHVQRRGLGIDGRATPLAATIEAGEDNAPFAARRREERVPQRPKAPQFLLGDVSGAYRLSRERRGLHWKRLRGPGVLAAQGRGRDRTLCDVEERFARLPVEQENEPALGDLCDGIDPCRTARHGHEIGRGGQVAIPEVVVHGLEVPQSFPGRRIEREQ